MPLYYFTVHNDDVTPDFEGKELADLQAARAYAIAAARALAADTVIRGHIGLSDAVEITDDQRRSLDRVTFGEAVEIRP